MDRAFVCGTKCSEFESHMKLFSVYNQGELGQWLSPIVLSI